MPDENGHPDAEEMELGAIFAALADPWRRQVVLTLAADPDEIRHCSSFELPVTKATRTHHFRSCGRPGSSTRPIAVIAERIACAWPNSVSASRD